MFPFESAMEIVLVTAYIFFFKMKSTSIVILGNICSAVQASCFTRVAEQSGEW